MLPKIILSLFCLVTICACSSGGGGDDDGGSVTGGNSSNTPGAVTDKGATLCGVVSDGKYQNPPDYTKGKIVSGIQPLDSNLVNVETTDGKTTLVQLQALGNTLSFDNTAAVKEMQALLNSGVVYFFQAGSCSVDSVAGKAVLGQLVTESGRSFSEELLEENYAGVIESSSSCGTSELSACYDAISSDAPIAAPSVVPGTTPARQVSDFLWKPDSESPYNPGGVSILTNPCDVKIIVNGVEMREYPTGNGRCVTVRSGTPGCEFGSNITIQVIDKASGEPVYFGNNDSVTLANGCDRFEYAGNGSGASSGGSEDSPAFACDVAPASVQYVPSLAACGGNAAVVMTGSFAGAFSVQLRLPDGGDRLDEECALASCSPYKVQQYIDGAGSKTACFGAPGTANVMEPVHHVSIKMAGDDSTPPRFCIPNPDVAVN